MAGQIDNTETLILTNQPASTWDICGGTTRIVNGLDDVINVASSRYAFATQRSDRTIHIIGESQWGGRNNSTKSRARVKEFYNLVNGNNNVKTFISSD